MGLRKEKNLAFRLVGTLNVKLNGDKEKRMPLVKGMVTLPLWPLIGISRLPQLTIKRGLQIIQDSVDRHIGTPDPAPAAPTILPGTILLLAGIKLPFGYIKDMGKVSRIAFVKTQCKNVVGCRVCYSIFTGAMVRI